MGTFRNKESFSYCWWGERIPHHLIHMLLDNKYQTSFTTCIEFIYLNNQQQGVPRIIQTANPSHIEVCQPLWQVVTVLSACPTGIPWNWKFTTTLLCGLTSQSIPKNYPSNHPSNHRKSKEKTHPTYYPLRCELHRPGREKTIGSTLPETNIAHENHHLP